MNVKEKIAERLDSLQLMMESQEHLSHPKLVTDRLNSVEKFWTYLCENDREYVSSVRLALKEGLEWKSQGQING